MNATLLRFLVLPAWALAIVMFAGTATAQYQVAPDPEAYRKQAMELVKRFAGELQGHLKSALEQGGPVNAIPVCADVAPAIAARLSRESGAFLRRVSLKIRNPLDLPDAWEQARLATFDRLVGIGEDPATLIHADFVDEPAGKFFRFMKAIPTQSLCLMCHGKAIDPETARVLNERYPHDVARGYEEGMVRGAFSVKIPVP